MKMVCGIAVAMGLAGLVSAEELVSNPGFETLAKDGGVAEWRWWTREKGAGRFEVSADRHGGERAVRIIHDGAKDWNLTNARKTPVKPGASYVITCWMKRSEGAASGSVNVVGNRGNKLVDWSIGRSPSATGNGRWRLYKGYFNVPDDVDTVYVRVVGSGKTDFWVDDVQVEPGPEALPPPGHKVSGWAKERPVEPMGPGLVAVQTRDGVHVGWRLLKDESADIAFNVFRESAGQRVKLNAEPIRQTTDFVDTNAFDASASYTVQPAVGFGGEVQTARVVPFGNSKTPYIRIPLSVTNATAQKVGIGDLDGDGVYDYVIKLPGENIDPAESYWYKSPDTFKIEAHKGDGTLLWVKDLGWNIERGMWYSPMVVADLNGDGRAEVAAKIGPEEDMRGSDGRVQKGPEWVAVFDGLTGREIARAPWLPRDDFENYNLASRNQLAVAYLDGKTPCLLVLRGTYGLMLADAWQLRAGKLEKLWSFTNDGLPSKYRGQGAHNCLCGDVDGDGRDEVILGDMTLDDDGSVLWTTGRGHNDAHYFGDIDPTRPGMELAYIIETAQRKSGGINEVDPATGKTIWALGEPTKHVHSCGMCTDIDPMQPGLEIYGADSVDHKVTEHRWLFSSDGRVLKSGTSLDFGFGVPSAWWDADLQRELIRGRAIDYEGGSVSEPMEGSVLLIADVIGDWREEVITTVKGEVRIYTTPIPSMDRRVCLMQDAPYRMRTTMNAMGYYQTPILSYVPEAVSPNLNLTIQKDGKRKICRVVVVAPLGRAVKGEVALAAPKGIKLASSSFSVDLKPGARVAETVAVDGTCDRGAEIKAVLSIDAGPILKGGVPLGL